MRMKIAASFAAVSVIAASAFGAMPALADDEVVPDVAPVVEVVVTPPVEDEVVPDVVPPAGGDGIVESVQVSSETAPADHKWYVCKYVGKPGVDERLQTGQNPIFVDENSIEISPVYIGATFSDEHTHSVVVAGPYDKKLTPEPGVELCPLPDGPDPLTGTDQRVAGQCVEGGIFETTTYGTDWTQAYILVDDEWVLGEKVYGEEYVIGVESVEDVECGTRTTPTLDGTFISPVCLDDAAYLDGVITLVDPDGLSTEDVATITLTDGVNSFTYPQTFALGPIHVLWPGASVDENGRGITWPGYITNADGTYTATDDPAYFGWTRGGVTVHVEVNPETEVTVEYPPSSPICLTSPPVPGTPGTPATPGTPTLAATGGGDIAPIVPIGAAVMTLLGISALVWRRFSAFGE